MDLQGNGTVALPYFFVAKVNHRLPVQERLHVIALNPNAECVPFGGLQNVFFFIGDLHQPVPAIGFVNAARIMVGWRDFHLPATDFGTFDSGTEKHATVAIGFLLELQRQVEVLVELFGGQVAVFLIGTAFADEFALFDVPFSVP